MGLGCFLLEHGNPDHGMPLQYNSMYTPLFVAKMGKEDTSDTEKATLQNRNNDCYVTEAKDHPKQPMKQSYCGAISEGHQIHSHSHCKFLFFLYEFHGNLQLQNCKSISPSLSCSPSSQLVYSRLHDMTIPYELIGVVYILCPKWLKMLEGNLQPWLRLTIIVNDSSLPHVF
eukprot:TRINITY_DN7550_c0_g1_i1.p1 TRINITY_DN7550_c0_g1~~TRINITY_DN7550_c0_g1_i1.p1  ORF type:complete len:172 (+),score=23.03 TRINITY_DN7550_c0_g1_i1:184-699(+)